MGGFYDVSTGGVLRLELRSVNGREFTLVRAFGYRDDEHEEPFVVPADLTTFDTDLASVPHLLTWLVPRSGDFLPAAVLHDALVWPGSYVGPPISRDEADRIFRRAMIALGTGKVRAWLMWAAATLGTLWLSGSLLWRSALVALLGMVVIIGGVATLDFFDVLDVLPWMGERPWQQELALGAVFAVLIPPVLALMWGRYWLAGAIVGVSLALLLHVTAVLLVLYAAYLALERLVSGPADDDGVRVRDRGRA